jgi:UDP-2-acetamido-2-deoxy-ribo-hexuluronate aminotransferase
MEFIDLKTQYERYKADIKSRIQIVLDHGHYIMGPEISELETTLANYVGVKHCISVANGTVSLEIALRALGVGPGHEVITVPFSWISSAEVIMLVRAKPVFVDIERDTFNMDASKLEAAITTNTKAIIPVSLFGQMPDLEAIQAIADKYQIAVIEDAAQSFGATRNGRKSCGSSLIGSTSFFPAKTFGCYGDGGALFTDDDHLAETMRAIRTHGGVQRHHHTHVGTNGRFDTLQAAILLAKWPWFKDEVAARVRIGARYSELLQGIVTTPGIADGNTHVYAQYTIRVDERQRAGIAGVLKSQGIPTGIYYPKCFHEQPVFADAGYSYGDFPESEQASREVLSLPMHPFLEESDLERVTNALNDAITPVCRTPVSVNQN